MAQGNYKNKTYPLRINAEIMERIKAIAAEENRTVNKQIEKILADYTKEYLSKTNITSETSSTSKIG